jgi:regulator of replication initiation timing
MPKSGKASDDTTKRPIAGGVSKGGLMKKKVAKKKVPRRSMKSFNDTMKKLGKDTSYNWNGNWAGEDLFDEDVLNAKTTGVSIKEIIEKTLEEISTLELEQKRLKQASKQNKNRLDEARKVDQWFNILKLAETDSSIAESVDHIITMYNLKIDHSGEK